MAPGFPGVGQRRTRLVCGLGQQSPAPVAQLPQILIRSIVEVHALLTRLRNADQHLGRPYVVTEVAEHGTVQDVLDNMGVRGIPVDDVVRWTRHACYGIARGS